ncbi:MAG TPA: redox-regulated ATPase YchF [Syntrophorhabdaceae bacterium]|nr:redox-regulated ATPase YchF [Syntrophorhabdaceae bacterium]HQM82872.1 redox-regulated ATPase YchF [Syntrophorhabdaceae bacterium]
MSFSCGMIGLPNSGKSTIFNALTALSVPCHPYPFCTIDPNVGVIPVPDERLAALAQILKPEKVTPTTIEFVDIAGLIKDAHKGEGLGNKFLSHIRNVDAIAHVVRCFAAENIPHVYSNIDPERDVEIVETEILISDLEIVEERLKKVERLAKVSKEKGEAEHDLLLKVKEALERGAFVDMKRYDENERPLIRSFNLIATKPVFYIANVDEDAWSNLPLPAVEGLAKRDRRRVVYICGKLEEDLSALPDEEKGSYMELYNMEKMSIGKVIRVGYETLELITFYTVVGKEMRAWTVPANTTCVKAAGKIHTDMEKGFIKADVINIDDFIRCGSEHTAKEKGLLRLEGRDYIVKDGDILHIRFN